MAEIDPGVARAVERMDRERVATELGVTVETVAEVLGKSPVEVARRGGELCTLVAGVPLVDVVRDRLVEAGRWPVGRSDRVVTVAEVEGLVQRDYEAWRRAGNHSATGPGRPRGVHPMRRDAGVVDPVAAMSQVEYEAARRAGTIR